MNILFLFPGNKRLDKKRFVYNKDNKETDMNKDIYAKISKKSFQYKIDELEYENLDEIHISYSLDNNLIYPTLVSMASGLENNNNNKNIIVYHLLLSHDFDTSKVEIFESLRKNYTVKINYYIIPHFFKNLNPWTAGTDCVYYKIILPIMFPNYKRIIYLDGDTLIRKDISEMFYLPFNDNYILGFPFYMTQVMDEYGINATHYINGGCLLFNIDKIRKDKKDDDLLQFTIKNNSVLRFREQDAINYVFYPKIGFLPLKYGIYMIGSKRKFKSLSRYTRSPLNLAEGYEAVKDPAIVHFSCCWPKVWTEGSKNLFKDHDICLRYKNEFYYYANKTQYYSKIYKLLIHQKYL
jgi:lipopolysaccharide biosynthesis glycosyltransferase